MANEEAKIGSMKFGAYVLDNFIAPKLSQLKSCSAPDLGTFESPFASYLLQSVFIRQYPQHIHAVMVVLIRRIEFACDQYRQGVRSLHEFIKILPHTNTQTGPFRSAISHFETCALHTYAAVLLLGSIGHAHNQKPMFKTKDGSDYDRLRIIVNRIKHFDEDIVSPETNVIKDDFSLVPMWLTNDGLETSQASLTFSELHDILRCACIDAQKMTSLLSEGRKIRTLDPDPASPT